MPPQADIGKYYTNEYLAEPPYTRRSSSSRQPLHGLVRGKAAASFNSEERASMSEPFIRLTNVGKTYQTKNGSVEACSDINLDIRQSEFVAIVGPSGCGKTTILKMVAGLTPYTAGTITVGGKRVDKPADRRRHRVPGSDHARLA